MRKALIIGINYQNTSIQLGGCINDGLLTKTALIDHYLYDRNDIIFMRDDIYNSHDPLFPSKDNIITQLTTLVTSEANTLYFHFSGHGSYIIDVSGDEKDGYDEMIIPADYPTTRNVIKDDEILNIIKNINDTSKLFMVFDCCNSGTMVDLEYSYSFSGETFSKDTENSMTDLSNKNTIICISGCRDDEYSYEINRSFTSGAMTLAMNTVLSENNWAMTINDLVIAIYGLLAHDQRPLITSNKSLVLTNEYFAFEGRTVVQNILIQNRFLAKNIFSNIVDTFVSTNQLTLKEIDEVIKSKDPNNDPMKSFKGFYKHKM